MIVDLLFLKRELHHRRLTMREFFRRAKISKTERICIMNGLCISSYTVARIAHVLNCRQDSLCASLPEEKSEALSLVL